VKYFIYLLLLISCLFGYEDSWYALNEQDEGAIRLTLNIGNVDMVRVTYSMLLVFIWNLMRIQAIIGNCGLG